jgi:hypothetical protein
MCCVPFFAETAQRILAMLEASPIYYPRNPFRSPLWNILHNNYEEFKANYDESYEKQYGFFRSVVDDVVHDYLKCADLKEGFARVRCTNPDCRNEYPCLPAGRSWHSVARDGGSAQAVILNRNQPSINYVQLIFTGSYWPCVRKICVN